VPCRRRPRRRRAEPALVGVERLEAIWPDRGRERGTPPVDVGSFSSSSRVHAAEDVALDGLDAGDAPDAIEQPGVERRAGLAALDALRRA
jgi:hypothetical protein